MIVTLADVISNVLAEVVVRAGGRLGRVLKQLQGRGSPSRAVIELLRDQDSLLPAFEADPERWTAADEARAVEVLATPSIRALIHELFAVRFSDASPARVKALEHSFVAGFPPDLSDQAGILIRHLDAQIVSRVELMRREMPQAYIEARQDAHLTLIDATVAMIARHTGALAATSDPEAEARFLERYRRQVLDYHGLIEPPDFERRRRVPLDDILVSPSIVPLPQDPERDESMDLAEFSRLIDRSVLLGDPGGGKTTCCHAVMYGYAAAAGDRIPFLVTLREFAAEDPPVRSVLGHIEHRLQTFYQCAPPVGLIERLLLNGAALIVFDGLDELVDAGRRADVASVVERFSVQYPLAAILVTSRAIGYDEARLDESQFALHRLVGFTPAKAADYVAKWFAQEPLTEQERELTVRDFLRSTAGVADLRANPLTLSLMCILYRGEGWIAQNRPEIYEQCSSLLFRRWDARRRIRVELHARALVEPSLRHLAYWLFTRKSSEPQVTERELAQQITGFLLTRSFESHDEAEVAALELVGFFHGRAWVFNDVGVTPRGENLYAFTHRTFLEYFAAAHLASLHDSPESLAGEIAPRVEHQEWDTVAQLAVQIKDRGSDRGAERLFRALLARPCDGDEQRESVLAFLGRCLAFTQPPAAVVRDLTREAAELAFRPNAFGSTCLNAIKWIMYNGESSYARLIATEITDMFSRRLAEPHVHGQIQALLLGTSLGDLPWLHQPELRYRKNYWDAVAEQFTEDHLDELARLAPQHASLAVEAFSRRRIDIAQLVQDHGMTILIRSVPHAIHRDGTGSSHYNHQPLVTVLLGDPFGFQPIPEDGSDQPPAVAAWLDWIRDQLRLLGETLGALPSPPWVNREVEDANVELAKYCPLLPSSTMRPLDEQPAAFALGVLVLMAAEVDTNPDTFIDIIERTPYLAQYAGYIRDRLALLNTSDRDESDASACPPGDALFARWANRNVSFTYAEHEHATDP